VTLLYLSRDQVRRLLPAVPEQLDLVDETYRALASGRVELPPKPGIHPRPDSFIHAMPAYLRDDDVAALKWVSGYPANKQRGLPYISGLIVVNEADTGLPAAVMDGAEITAARTAAASGVCAHRWAPPGWGRASILGCGEQGRFHALVLNALNPGVRIQAYDPHPERIEQLKGNVVACSSWEEAVDGADVIVSAGPIVDEPEPPIATLAEASLALPIDFDFYFSAAAVESADLFLVDDVEQFEYYRGQGRFEGWPAPAKSVGEAILDGSTGHRVVCCNLGVAALDAAFAAEVVSRAGEEGIGTELPL
jgi:alanine dehydrogenase